MDRFLKQNLNYISTYEQDQLSSLRIVGKDRKYDTHLSESKTKRWFAGSWSAAANNNLSASTMVASPHTTCETQPVFPRVKIAPGGKKKESKWSNLQAPRKLPPVKVRRSRGGAVELEPRRRVHVHREPPLLAALRKHAAIRPPINQSFDRIDELNARQMNETGRSEREEP
jgi:hypothetical protein